MNKKQVMIGFVFGIFLLVNFASVSGDTLEVFYTVNFTAQPNNSNMETSWISHIAGGTDQPINILYGVYMVHTEENTNLTIGSGQSIAQEFIEISGSNGSWQAIGKSVNIKENSITSNLNYPAVTDIEYSSPIEDCTPNPKVEGECIRTESYQVQTRVSLNLTRSFDNQGDLNGIKIEGKQTPYITRVNVPEGLYDEIPESRDNATIGDYVADPNTIQQFGDSSSYINKNGELISGLTSQFA